MSIEKRKIFISLAVFIFVPIFLTTQQNCKHINFSPQFLAAISCLIAATYILLITIIFDDSDSPLSWKASVIAFVGCGTVSLILTSCIYPLLDLCFADNSLYSLLEHVDVDAGPVEETAKLLAVLLIPPVRTRITDRKSGIFYVTLCAIGFAAIENFEYFYEANEVIFIRANPSHAVFSAIWGAALGEWLAGKGSMRKLIFALLAGMGVHAIWNISTVSSLVFIPIAILTLYVGTRFIRKELSPAIKNRTKTPEKLHINLQHNQQPSM